MIKSLTKENSTLKKEIDELNKENKSFESREQELRLEFEIKSLENSIESLKQELTQKENELTNINSRFKEQDKLIKKQQKEISSLRIAIQDPNDLFINEVKEVKILKERNEKVEKEMLNLKNENDSLKKEKELIEVDLQKENEKYRELEKSMNKMKQALTEMNGKDRIEFESKLSKFTDEITSLKTEVDKLNKEKSFESQELRSECASTSSKENELKQQIKSLTEENNTLKKAIDRIIEEEKFSTFNTHDYGLSSEHKLKLKLIQNELERRNIHINNLFLYGYNRLRQTEEHYIGIVNKKDDKIKSLENSIGLLKQGLTQKENELTNIKSRTGNSSFKEQEKLIKEQQKEINNYKSSSKANDKRIKRLKGQINRLIDLYKNSKNDVKDSDSKVIKLTKENSSLEKEKLNLKNENDSLKKEKELIEVDLQKENEKNREQEKAMNKMKQALGSMTEKKKKNKMEFKSKVCRFTDEIASLKTKIDKLNQEKKSFESKEQELRSEFEAKKDFDLLVREEELNEIHKKEINLLKQKLADKLVSCIFDFDLKSNEDSRVSQASYPETGWSSSSSTSRKTAKNEKTRFNSSKNQWEVFAACHSYEDAMNAAMNHGLDHYRHPYYDTPIHDDSHNPEDPDYFPHFHLGKQNQKIIVTYNGVSYNYHYYYGVNDHGVKAREQPGCDKPVPYYV